MIRLANGLTLFVGGARSGKSDVVVRLAAAWPGEVVFVATATAGDDNMAERIERHQLDRPAEWALVEDAHLDATALQAIDTDALVIIDCITLLCSNLLFDDRSEHDIVEHVGQLADAAARRSAPTLVVTNEVGLGIHPESELGRRYRDLLGRANRRIAEAAELSLFVVAGRAIVLEEIETTW